MGRVWVGRAQPSSYLKVRATKYRYVSGANRTLQGHKCGIWEAGWMCGPWSISDTVTQYQIMILWVIVGEQVYVTERETSQRTQQIRPGLGEHRPCI